MIDSRIEMAEERFRTLLLKWLDNLPSDGWEGTSHQLGDELAAFGDRHRLFAYVPLCPGQKVAGMVPFFSANGFSLTHRRTKRQRTLRFTRNLSPDDARAGGRRRKGVL